MSAEIKSHPDTWDITHIFDGEEVVTGGEDGQEYIRTFESHKEAQQFIDNAKAFATTRGPHE